MTHCENQKRRNTETQARCRVVALAKTAAIAAFSLGVTLCQLGCSMDDAARLAGYSRTEPKVKVRKTWTGFDVIVGTDFNGSAKGDYDRETGKLNFDIQVASGVSSVLTAEGERADHLVRLREIESAYKIRSQEIVGENFQAFGTMLAIATAAGGDAVSKVIDAAAPILAGSGISVPLGALGNAAINLGNAETPTRRHAETPPPEPPSQVVQPP